MRMTWEQFVKKVEAAGVTPASLIEYIDISWPNDGIDAIQVLINKDGSFLVQQ
jgi:hypothetical protein